jgi:hypothetical protein
MSTNPQKAFREGTAFLELSRDIEDRCAFISIAQSLKQDQNDVAARLGTVLPILYRLACCHWGCHGKEHVF